jgi:hypothetical protein
MSVTITFCNKTEHERRQNKRHDLFLRRSEAEPLPRLIQFHEETSKEQQGRAGPAGIILEPSSALNQVNDQNNDSNYEEKMDQTASNVADEAQKPEDDQDDNYSPKHGYSFWLSKVSSVEQWLDARAFLGSQIRLQEIGGEIDLVILSKFMNLSVRNRGE